MTELPAPKTILSPCQHLGPVCQQNIALAAYRPFQRIRDTFLQQLMHQQGRIVACICPFLRHQLPALSIVDQPCALLKVVCVQDPTGVLKGSMSRTCFISHPSIQVSCPLTLVDLSLVHTHTGSMYACIVPANIVTVHPPVPSRHEPACRPAALENALSVPTLPAPPPHPFPESSSLRSVIDHHCKRANCVLMPPSVTQVQPASPSQCSAPVHSATVPASSARSGGNANMSTLPLDDEDLDVDLDENVSLSRHIVGPSMSSQLRSAQDASPLARPRASAFVTAPSIQSCDPLGSPSALASTMPVGSNMADSVEHSSLERHVHQPQVGSGPGCPISASIPGSASALSYPLEATTQHVRGAALQQHAKAGRGQRKSWLSLLNDMARSRRQDAASTHDRGPFQPHGALSQQPQKNASMAHSGLPQLQRGVPQLPAGAASIPVHASKLEPGQCQAMFLAVESGESGLQDIGQQHAAVLEDRDMHGVLVNGNAGHRCPSAHRSGWRQGAAAVSQPTLSERIKAMARPQQRQNQQEHASSAMMAAHATDSAVGTDQFQHGARAVHAGVRRAVLQPTRRNSQFTGVRTCAWNQCAHNMQGRSMMSTAQCRPVRESQSLIHFAGTGITHPSVLHSWL
jgi:hypothetical protein